MIVRLLSNPITMGIISRFIDILIIFIPVVGYIDTARLMIAEKTPKPFKYTVYLSIIEYTWLRVILYFFERYDYTIFFQNIALTTISMVIAGLYFKYRKIEFKKRGKQSNWKFLLITNSESFTEFFIYFFTYTIIICIGIVFGSVIFSQEATLFFLTAISNIGELLYPLPLFKQVVIDHDLKGISIVLVIQYIAGDFVKLAINIIKKSPAAFILATLGQLAIDSITCPTYFILSLKNRKLSKQNDQELEQLGDISLETIEKD